MNEIINPLLSFVLGLASGFIGAISAGGGIISISGLIFLGLSPTAAIATSRLEALTGDVASFTRFNKAGLIKWKYVPPVLVVAVFGALIGSRLLLRIDEQVLEKAVGVVLLILAFLVAINRDFGSKAKIKSRKRHNAGLITLFLVYIYAGAFGGAAGIFLIYALIYFYGMSFLQASANKKIIGSFATVPALIVFMNAGVVDYKLGIPLAMGALLGAYVGAHTAIKEGNKLVRLVFLIMVVVSALTLLL